MAFPLSMGTTDPPVIALICLALALLARDRRPLDRPAWRSDSVLAAVVLGVACAMKYTAWPALAIIAVLVATRNGVRPAVRFTATVLAAAAALVVALAPAALRHPASILQNTVAYPLGLTIAKPPAEPPARPSDLSARVRRRTRRARAARCGGAGDHGLTGDLPAGHVRRRRATDGHRKFPSLFDAVFTDAGIPLCAAGSGCRG
jgi:hypothetical protein